MRKVTLLPALLLLLLVATSCGYRFGHSETLDLYETVSIPYIEGDTYGEFTAAVIKKVSQSTNLDYVRDGGDLLLKIKILEIKEENVGFRYERKKKGKLVHYIIPTETRLQAIGEIQTLDAETGESLFGPYQFAASIVFDHDYYSSRNAVNIFSLGQLIDYDAAYDAALKPLSQAFAEKVGDILRAY